MRCFICHHEQAIPENQMAVYATKHPLFASCKRVPCNACGSSWVLNPPKLNLLQQYYEEEVDSGNGWLSFLERPTLTLERCQAKARWDFIRDAFTRSKQGAIPSEMSVCDIGAGFGCTLEIGKHEGYALDYFAYETSQRRRKKIEALGGTTEENFLGESASRRFDLVWASHILEHYSDPDVLLQQMGGLMSEKGIGFIEIPCLDYEFKNEIAPHLLFFSVAGLKKALERNGFDVWRIDSTGPLRKSAKEPFAIRNGIGSLKNRLKSVMPKPVLTLGRNVTILTKALSFEKQATVAEDLASREVFKKWELNTYGGDRCWIRAVFAHR